MADDTSQTTDTGWLGLVTNIGTVFDKGLDVYTSAVNRVKAIGATNNETVDAGKTTKTALANATNTVTAVATKSSTWIYIGVGAAALAAILMLWKKR